LNGTKGEREQEIGWMITSPLRSRWQAHGELRIAVTSVPRHELLLNVELVLRMVLLKAAVAETGLQLLL